MRRGGRNFFANIEIYSRFIQFFTNDPQQKKKTNLIFSEALIKKTNNIPPFFV